ncbi:aldose epimerase family protein [Dongia rigui]|uniref:Aldose 1-epimerase n=1 Tax=Dongia rigui TaxID=940149 RepID=A0ABU5DYJ2_9PROT|nr:aldose epimerase family protein [Dongia rigui]MDY0872365.1 aldose epimerase family protein [Dongia rigui]
MAHAPFGKMDDGATVNEIRLGAGALGLSILTHGARIHGLTFQGRPRVLGFANIADYLTHAVYAGAVAGRYANRIAGGRFSLDGKSYQLPCNERGRTHLHGGMRGFAHRNWDIVEADDTHVTLTLVSPDGEEGYPGTLQTYCTYSLDGNDVRITLTATTDAPTIINLATHSYFNLDGSGDILGHRLTIPADHYLPVDDDLIPTGAIADVSGTAFDFRTPTAVGARGQRYDHNFVLSKERQSEPRLAASLEGPQSRTRLDVLSTEPGLQFYDGGYLAGGGFGAHGGLCLEPQVFPNAPNEPGFSKATLRPGETYRQVTLYRFSEI